MTAAYRALHAVWRQIPHSIRRSAFHAVTHLLGPRPSNLTVLTRGPITVLGLLHSTTGLGEGARLCLKALTELGFTTNYFDVSPAFLTADLPTPPNFGTLPQAREGGALIAHINPHMLPLGLLQLGPQRLRNKYVIGYWAWELEHIPQKWLSALKYVHEIWVPSRFTANAFSSYTSKPIRVVPHPVVTPIPSSRSRSEFGLRADQFVVLTLLHMGSGCERKNPLGAIRAFQLAFGTDPRYFLIVKIADAEVHPQAYQALRQAIGDAGNIRLFEDKLSITDMAALMVHSDTIISLHRSEGFGLVLAQAMLLGKPVIATAWSGNMDFMNARNSALVDAKLIAVADPQLNYTQTDQRWAEPDTQQAADWLRRLAADPSLRQRIASTAQSDTSKRFDLSTYRTLVQPALAPHCYVSASA